MNIKEMNKIMKVEECSSSTIMRSWNMKSIDIVVVL